MTAHESRLQLEAAAYVVAARVAIRTVPFRWLTRLFERSVHKPELQGAARDEARRDVRRAIYMATRRLPGETVCFPWAIAAQAMLRRRGVGTVIYCGASRSAERGLTAHVWLQDGEIGVTGYRASKGYKPLARYPVRSE